MQDADKNHELISALVDGQLRGEEFARTVEWLSEAAEAQSTWHTYHVLGEVLRSGEGGVSAGDTAFMQRLKQGLQAEASGPSRVVAIDLITADAMPTRALGLNDAKYRGANDSRFRWKLLAGVASLAAVSLIGWQLVFHGGPQQGLPQLAQVPVPVGASAVAGAETAVMIRDPQLDALLAAHRQFGGTSALQMPAGFLRNATFEGTPR